MDVPLSRFRCLAFPASMWYPSNGKAGRASRSSCTILGLGLSTTSTTSKTRKRRDQFPSTRPCLESVGAWKLAISASGSFTLLGVGSSRFGPVIGEIDPHLLAIDRASNIYATILWRVAGCRHLFNNGDPCQWEGKASRSHWAASAFSSRMHSFGRAIRSPFVGGWMADLRY